MDGVEAVRTATGTAWWPPRAVVPGGEDAPRGGGSRA
jgi:hypothetical protein